MKSKILIIFLLVLTFLLFPMFLYFSISQIQMGTTTDESALRLLLSDDIAFMKDNFDLLEEKEIKEKLDSSLRTKGIQLVLYSSKSGKINYVFGKEAIEISKTNIENTFGLKQEAPLIENLKELNWLLYKDNQLLGVAKIIIKDGNSSVRLKQELFLKIAIGFIFFILLLGLGVYQLLREKNQLIKLFKESIMNLSKGVFSANIAQKNDNPEVQECFILFDRMRQDLKEFVHAKEEYEKSRKVLINYLMHDLRTPIASIRALTEGLVDGIPKTEEAKKHYYLGIHKKINELEKLTDDLFHHVNIEVGALEVQMDEMYCDEALKPILRNLKSVAKDFNGKLEVDETISHVLVKLDVRRMEQAIINLVVNAIKYSQKNGWIKIRAKKEDEMIVICVEDNGIGIGKEDLPFIFEDFFRGEKSRSREFGGTGLGLSIVKYIVEKHGGYVSVKSKLGEGSCFKLHIPVV
jgi:signal transduction histidine kinase